MDKINLIGIPSRLSFDSILGSIPAAISVTRLQKKKMMINLEPVLSFFQFLFLSFQGDFFESTFCNVFMPKSYCIVINMHLMSPHWEITNEFIYIKTTSDNIARL